MPDNTAPATGSPDTGVTVHAAAAPQRPPLWWSPEHGLITRTRDHIEYPGRLVGLDHHSGVPLDRYTGSAELPHDAVPLVIEPGQCLNCQHGRYHHNETNCDGVCGNYTPAEVSSVPFPDTLPTLAELAAHLRQADREHHGGGVQTQPDGTAVTYDHLAAVTLASLIEQRRRFSNWLAGITP